MHLLPQPQLGRCQRFALAGGTDLLPGSFSGVHCVIEAQLSKHLLQILDVLQRGEGLTASFAADRGPSSPANW